MLYMRTASHHIHRLESLGEKTTPWLLPVSTDRLALLCCLGMVPRCNHHVLFPIVANTVLRISRFLSGPVDPLILPLYGLYGSLSSTTTTHLASGALNSLTCDGRISTESQRQSGE